MKISWLFSILSASFFLSMIGCASDKIAITCRPSSLSGNSSGERGMITIAWDSGDDSKVAGYKIFYGTDSGKYKDCIDIGKPPESSPGEIKYTLTGLRQGKEYFLSVAAYSISKESSILTKEVSAMAK